MSMITTAMQEMCRWKKFEVRKFQAQSNCSWINYLQVSNTRTTQLRCTQSQKVNIDVAWSTSDPLSDWPDIRFCIIQQDLRSLNSVVFKDDCMYVCLLKYRLQSCASGTEPNYQEIWRADGHGNSKVGPLNYTTVLDDLPALSDGHCGWLISFSRNLLILWECVSREGEAALQVFSPLTIICLSSFVRQHRLAGISISICVTSRRAENTLEMIRDCAIARSTKDLLCKDESSKILTSYNSQMAWTFAYGKFQITMSLHWESLSNPLAFVLNLVARQDCQWLIFSTKNAWHWNEESLHINADGAQPIDWLPEGRFELRSGNADVASCNTREPRGQHGISCHLLSKCWYWHVCSPVCCTDLWQSRLLLKKTRHNTLQLLIS